MKGGDRTCANIHKPRDRHTQTTTQSQIDRQRDKDTDTQQLCARYPPLSLLLFMSPVLGPTGTADDEDKKGQHERADGVRLALLLERRGDLPALDYVTGVLLAGSAHYVQTISACVCG